MIYTYAFTSKKYAFFDDHSFSRVISLSLPLSLFHSLALFRSLATVSCILACTYSINREPRYCTAFPHLSALVAFTLARVSPHPRFAAVVMLSEAALVRPHEQTHRFFVVISINKEIPIQGRTLAYPMR